MTTLSDIRERAQILRDARLGGRDALVRAGKWPHTFDQCATDRAYLLSLIDAYQAREREARELMQEICRPWKGWDLSDGHSVRRAEAWLAATPAATEKPI